MCLIRYIRYTPLKKYDRSISLEITEDQRRSQKITTEPLIKNKCRDIYLINGEGIMIIIIMEGGGRGKNLRLDKWRDTLSDDGTNFSKVLKGPKRAYKTIFMKRHMLVLILEHKPVEAV